MLIRRLAVAIGLLCGLIGAQAPEFAQQYRQRLAGALDELNRVVAEFDAESAAQSLTPSEGVARLKTNGDALARERGEAIESDAARANRLRRQLEALQAGGLSGFAGAIANFDAATAGRALEDFSPALPLTATAFIVGAAAFVFGWGATHALALPIRRARRARLAARGMRTA
jgi:hypothetical protein